MIRVFFPLNPDDFFVTAMAERFHRVCGRGLSLAGCVCLGLLLAESPTAASDNVTRSDAAGPTGSIRLDSELTAEAQRELAERYSPVLVFHPSEKYFPTSPLFPLERQRSAADTDASIASRLGTADERRAYYEGLTVPQKAGLSTVYYRAYHARTGGEPVVVVEYWLYYVYNAYRVRGNILPFWIDGSHPNDLEHIHVVLRRTDDGEYALREVYTSAHTGTMPANRHRYDEDHAPERTRFLVELGSHAIAPDVDGDGMFTPGVDGSSGYKVLWGIRDRGITWARYQPRYMDARTVGNSVVFSYAGAAPEDGGYSYRLVPADRLQTAFDDLRLTKSDRQAIFETDRTWFHRMFGGDNGSSSKLLVPPPRSEDRNSIGIDRFASTERGFMAGVQLNAEQQGGFVGARYAYLLGGKYIPDVMFQADALFVGQTYLSSQVMMSYPIDGSTTVMLGRGLVTDSLRFENRQWDWVGAVEFPLGRMRLYVSCRSWGPLTKYTQEVRLAYFF
jgi:hypothetical protein